ncbi:ankyrin repeat domain-containing protein [Paenibacillus lignilyticus]|uniref:Ankyrin repeat domain-containing protein n=1 Tax=Paenibacillus lignilyticus TaxID=1172615 RepID=A0ABS5CNE7_9BACL|nr:ankyrin repeat domain-containing protein [Paenibacillus lignilyticus]MBP3967388.1 ankyrin repeat domain-containing protein [Paenibacillus lignilyticus]
MNKYIRAVKALDVAVIKELLQKEPKWLQWSEEDGKNALHYVCGLDISDDPRKVDATLQIVKLLLTSGMDLNGVQRIPDDRCGFFSATPLWYAYTRGRNEKLYTYLLNEGANPNNCMFAIAWYNDVKAAIRFKEHGAEIEDSVFLSAFNWKKFEIAEWFLKNGTNVDYADSDGNTALHQAIQRKYKMDQIEMLLQFGADCNQANKHGISPKTLAGQTNRTKVLRLFEAQ